VGHSLTFTIQYISGVTTYFIPSLMVSTQPPAIREYPAEIDAVPNLYRRPNML